MGVYLPIKDYSAIQGPAPSGFHVPLTSEWTALYSILTTTLGLTGDGNLMKSYLKAPFAGIREGSTSNVKGQGSYGYFWLSTPGTSNLASEVYFTSSSITNYGDARSKAFTIRCFKNSPVSPDNTWTTLYDGSGIAAGAGIFHNATLGLISISGDGLTWITIADKNLGATTVYNDGDTLSESNCGKYYQRGNNYGFAWTGTITTSSTKVDASTYGPGNYYSSSTFIIDSGNWDSSNTPNLWGGVTGVVTVQKELKNAYIGIPDPTSIVLNKSAISLTTVGQTEQLTATIEPTVSDKTINWTTSDSTVATVSTTGLVTCVTPGTATITATTVNGLTATCSVGQGWQPGANTIAYYPLTSSSTVNDESGNNNNLTNSGASFGTYDGVDCGYFNNAYAYKSGSLFIGDPTFTVSIWAKTTTTSYGKNFWGFGTASGTGCLGLWLNSARLYTGGWDNDRNTGYTFNTSWHHVVFSYSNGSGTVYVDGISVYNGTWSPNIQNNYTTIGSNAALGDKRRGYLSEAIFEDKVWTTTEISDYYNQTKSIYGIS